MVVHYIMFTHPYEPLQMSLSRTMEEAMSTSMVGPTSMVGQGPVCKTEHFRDQGNRSPRRKQPLTELFLHTNSTSLETWGERGDWVIITPSLE